ncbi:CwfJ C-terminus 1-domain-containing protein-like protein [Morchella snyderi]|nr:CwfJ C-terminus 1-domain-containing protein-like protein [Morchella snyderi]
MAAKILVIGATNGRFIEAFTKATALHTKNNFSLALLLGDLFAAPGTPDVPSDTENIQKLLRGEIKVPLPTYFGLGRHSLPPSVREKIASSGEVCENLFFLGKKTVLNTSEGVRIVALGGRLDANIQTDAKVAGAGAGVGTGAGSEAADLPYYSPQDAKTLKGCNSADLLLTYDWPADIERGSAVPLPAALGGGGGGGGNPSIAELAMMIRPRYHFAPAGAAFWEREPYRNVVREKDGKGEVRVTRFLGVGDWGNEAKAKSLYAFSITPQDTNVVVPPNATLSPYREKAKKRTAGQADGGGSFFWGEHIRDDRGGKRGKGPHGGPRAPKPPPGPEDCFFCLSYPKLEKHLIVSIGNDAYLTTAKGPLTKASAATLPFASHILIIPLTHTPTLALMDDGDARDSTLAEMTRYRDAIGRMLKARGFGTVTFEIARAGGVHAHWQVVPVPMDKLAGVEAAFRDEAEKDGLAAWERREVVAAGGEDYFRVWVGGLKEQEGEGERERGALVLPLRGGEYFDLQFGRRVLAKVLGLQTVHWKDCVLSLEEEKEDAERFKEAFKEFDFSL